MCKNEKSKPLFTKASLAGEDCAKEGTGKDQCEQKASKKVNFCEKEAKANARHVTAALAALSTGVEAKATARHITDAPSTGIENKATARHATAAPRTSVEAKATARHVTGAPRTSVEIEDDMARFESDEAYQKLKSLLVIKCKECKKCFGSKKELLFHFKSAHSALLCSTCIENNHQFWYEYVTYTPESLNKHRKGTLGEAGFDGHIHCPFCALWLYNKDCAKRHGNYNHQICTVCDSLGIKFQFYRDYAQLEEHYRSRHYCCDSPACIRNYCYVYAYKSELCVHCMSVHGKEMQINNVSLKNVKNPVVFSLHDASSGEEPVAFARGTGIEAPIVSQPYFPSFAERGAGRNSSSELPSFLNRQQLQQAKSASTQRENLIRGISSGFYKEIAAIIEKYIAGSKPQREMVVEIEECVGKKECLKIISRVEFGEKRKEMGEFLPIYKKEVQFPPFERKIKKEPELVKKSKEFRIIDFTRKA